MKKIVPALKALPVLQVIELAEMLVNHSTKMEQIKKEYHLAKSEMKRRYKLQQKALDHDLVRFKKMAKLQAKRFNHGHVERMKLLQMTQEVTTASSLASDAQTREHLNGVMELLLNHYQKNREEQIDFLEFAQTPMIGGK